MAAPVHPYSDYGVALRTLRSARSSLGWVLFFCVVVQFLGFATMYWTQQPYTFMKPGYEVQRTRFDDLYDQIQLQIQDWTPPPAATQGAGTQSATQAGVETMPAVTMPPRPLAVPFLVPNEESRRLNIHKQWDATYTVLVPVTQMLGLIAAASIPVLVFITLLLVLVAQAPGVAQITRALIWSVLLLFLVLPWQYFMQSFPIPGILYGYSELLRFVGPHVVPSGTAVPLYEKFILIARFILWPLLAMVVLLITSERLRAGLMLSIGHPIQSMAGGGRGRVPAAGAGGGTPARKA